MNNKLDCSIIKDLLPSYADGLTSSETNKAIEAHMQTCKSCSDTLRRMTEPEPPAPLHDVKDVDYLKKVRNHSKKVTALVSFCAAALILVLVIIKVFMIGVRASESQIYFNTSVSGNYVNVSGGLTSSGSGVSHVYFHEHDGVVTVKVYTVPCLFFKSGDFNETYKSNNKVSEVRFESLTLWSGGIEITPLASKLFSAKNPYVGDMPANARLADILGITARLGSFTSELQTASEPYGWTIKLSQIHRGDSDSLESIRKLTSDYSYLLLSAINNLGYVSWEFDTSSAGRQIFTVTCDDASAAVGKDIKQYSSSPSELQKLLYMLDIDSSHAYLPVAENSIVEFSVINNCLSDIYGLGFSFTCEQTSESHGVTNADNTPIKPGEILNFTFTACNLSSSGAAGGSQDILLTLTVLDEDGHETVAARDMLISYTPGSRYIYELSGSFQNGFIVTEQ